MEERCSNQPILQTKELTKYFKTSRGLLHAVDHVNLSISANKTLGVVGESGCGKSTLGRTILKLIEPTSGEILYHGVNIESCSASKMRDMRRKMQIIFQDPYASLDPRKSVKDLIADPLKVYGVSKAEREDIVFEIIKRLELPNALHNPIRTSLTEDAASVSVSRVHWCSIRNSSFAMSRSARWMFRFRHRF